MIPPPPGNGDWPFFAAVAADLLAERERLYPGFVEKATLTPEQAAAGIRIMGAIAADWRRIAALYAGEEVGPRDDTATEAEKAREMARAIDRPRAIFTRLLAALPTTFDAGPAVRGDYVDCTGLDLDELIIRANDGRILPHAVRPVARARDRLFAVAFMLEHTRRRPSQMFHGEITAELRARARQQQRAA